MGAQVRCLDQKFIIPSKMLTSVKLMYVLPLNKLAIIYPLGFMLNGFKFAHDALYSSLRGFKICVFGGFPPFFGIKINFDFFPNNCLVKISENWQHTLTMNIFNKKYIKSRSMPEETQQLMLKICKESCDGN